MRNHSHFLLTLRLAAAIPAPNCTVPEVPAQEAANRSKIPVTLINASAQAIPLDTGSVDALVTTWTLCSISDAAAALEEMRRVLKPEPACQLLFVEHGRAPEVNVCRWQDRLTPIWKKIGGGCHLNRPIRDLLEHAGFKSSVSIPATQEARAR